VACPESGCGARVSARELARHICRQCTHREAGCRFESSVMLVAQHEAAECEWRSVECPEDGCGARLLARELGRHVCRKCRKPCCGFQGSPALVAQHEAAECEWRKVVCAETNCGARLLARELAQHICRKCKHRRAGCQFKGSPTLVAQHVAAECEWRKVACLETGCGVRVTARHLDVHKARHALQQRAEQLARRPDRQPRRGQASAEEEKVSAPSPSPAVESGEAEAALERMLALQQEGAVVVVDVGGRRFSTAVSTVKKFPGSLLARVSQPRKHPASNQSQRSSSN
jgi:hypothetical protein